MPESNPITPDTNSNITLSTLVEVLADTELEIGKTSDYHPTSGRVLKDSEDGTIYLADGTSWNDVSSAIGIDTPRTQTDEAAIGKQTDPDFVAGAERAVSNITNDADYNNEPHILKITDTLLVLVYRTGNSHAGDAGKLVSRRSTDRGETWSGETTIIDSADDDRNQSVGYIPESDKIVCFLRQRDVSAGTNTDVGYVVSDDRAQSWGSFTSVDSKLTNNIPVPFGGIVDTSNGYMTCFYNGSGQAHALFSTDNGSTWGSEVQIADESATVNTFQEPAPIAITSDKVVVLARNQPTDKTDYDGFIAATSSDGGSTWGSTTRGSPLSLMTQPTPFWPIKTSPNQVVVVWGDRDNFRIIKQIVPADALHANPQVLERIQKSVEYESAATDTADFGYPTAIRMGPNPENVYAAWYDDESGDPNSPDIYAGSLSGSPGEPLVVDKFESRGGVLLGGINRTNDIPRLAMRRSGGADRRIITRDQSDRLSYYDLENVLRVQFKPTAAGEDTVFHDHNGTVRLKVTDFGAQVVNTPLYLDAGINYVKADLAATTGNDDWEVRVHNGSGTPPEGLYRWDEANTQWTGIDPNTNGTTI